jgi:hypothetical protein
MISKLPHKKAERRGNEKSAVTGWKSAPALQDPRFTFPTLYENQTEMQP